MRNRGVLLLAVLAVLLLLAVLGGEIWHRAHSKSEERAPEALLDAVMDRIGVTRWAELLGWYEMEEEGLLPSGEADEARPVWTARQGGSRYHSIPACGGLKSPVPTTLGAAQAEGYRPCPTCWDVTENAP